MNDELSGQLTELWNIPTYAQKLIWLDTEAGSAQTEGDKGLFELPAPSVTVTVRWGGDTGAPLTQLRWQPDVLGWDGTVRVGGLVEAIHLTEFAGIVLGVVYISAQPLYPHTLPYPDAARRQVITPPDYLEGVDETESPEVLTVLVSDESPLFQVAQDSLTNSLPLHVYGRLSDEEEGWHTQFALPILWEAVTIFAP